MYILFLGDDVDHPLPRGFVLLFHQATMLNVDVKPCKSKWTRQIIKSYAELNQLLLRPNYKSQESPLSPTRIHK